MKTAIYSTESKILQEDRLIQKNISKAAKYGSISFVGQIIGMVFSFLFSFLLARYLGASDYGLYQLTVTIITIAAAVSSLGLTGGIIRFIPLARLEHNTKKIWGIIQIGIGVPFVIGLLIMLFLNLNSYFVANFIFKKVEIAILIKYASPAIPFLVVTLGLSAIAVAFKKIHYDVYTNLVFFNIIKFFLALVVILIGGKLIGLTFTYVISIIASFFLIFIFTSKTLNFDHSFFQAERNYKNIIFYSIPLYFSRLLDRFSKQFEILVLGAYGVSYEIGIYAILIRLSALGNLIFNSLKNISRPIMVELYSQNKITELSKFYQTITKWGVIFNIPIFLSFILFGKEILSMFGQQFILGYASLVLLSGSMLFNAFTGTCGTLINMAGYTKVSLINSIIYIGSTLIFDFTLIPKYGLWGAALAGAITIIILNIVRLFEVYFLINILPFNLSFIKPLFSATVTVISIYGAKALFFKDAPILQVIIFLPVMVLIYYLLIIALGISVEDKRILNKFFAKIKLKLKK